MTKVEDYRATLRQLRDWEPYLLAESRLPGPRGNLELAEAVSLEGDAPLFARLRDDNGPEAAPENTPECFLAFCGVLGLGADGPPALPALRRWAGDPRWRVREAVAMAVQRIADTRPAEAVEAMRDWARGSRLEQRAAVAALCEPRLLRDDATAQAALEILDEITASLATGSGDGAASPSTGSGDRAASPSTGSGDRAASPSTGSGDGAASPSTGSGARAAPPAGSGDGAASPAAGSGDVRSADRDGEKALRKGLSYGWSVAVVGRPDPGRALMERWIADGDAGTRRIMRENLRKARLARLDGEWVQRQLARI